MLSRLSRRQHRTTRGGTPCSELLAHRAWNPPPSASLAEETTPPLTPPPYGGARFPTLAAEPLVGRVRCGQRMVSGQHQGHRFVGIIGNGGTSSSAQRSSGTPTLQQPLVARRVHRGPLAAYDGTLYPPMFGFRHQVTFSPTCRPWIARRRAHNGAGRQLSQRIRASRQANTSSAGQNSSSA
jgi:hypothetical protein